MAFGSPRRTTPSDRLIVGVSPRSSVPAVVTAQFVGGKAARDALFLAQLDVTSLPAMVIATSIFSIALVAVNAEGRVAALAGEICARGRLPSAQFCCLPSGR